MNFFLLNLVYQCHMFDSESFRFDYASSCPFIYFESFSSNGSLGA